jgi:hypothetical protein
MYSRGFLGTVPTDIIRAALRTSDVKTWKSVYVACSGTFRIERMLFSSDPGLQVHSNDVSLLSVAIGKYLRGEQLAFRFKGQLGFVEDLDLCPSERIAAIIVALNISGYAVGKPNPYKAANLAHHVAKFASYISQVRKRLDDLPVLLPIASFSPCDWLDHVGRAIESGAGVLAYPPTVEGGYEKMFGFLNENVDWTPPDYRIWNPSDLPAVIEKLDRAGTPYFVYTDRPIQGRRPALECVRKGFLPVLGYSSSQRTAFLAPKSGQGESFAYRRIDPRQLSASSKVSIEVLSGAKMTFLKYVFLKKTILFGAGDINLAVYLDGMLAGGIVYKRDQYRPNRSIFLLSDFSTTREARIAKLIARVATSRDLIRLAEKRYVERFERVLTAVFSDNPVSMKYRGSFELLKREEVNGPAGRYSLSYASEVRSESIQEAYAWWWARDGKREVGKARDGAAKSRPEDVTPAGGERPLHGAGTVHSAS